MKQICSEWSQYYSISKPENNSMEFCCCRKTSKKQDSINGDYAYLHIWNKLLKYLKKTTTLFCSAGNKLP